MENARNQCLAQALKILSRCRQTKVQLKQKLKRKGYESEIIDSVLMECEFKRYIDDKEFAFLWVEDRKKFKPMGRWRLRQEMLQKGINDAVIEGVLDEILHHEEEYILLEQLFREKWGAKEIYQNKPQKLVNFLQRRGFTKDQIFQVAENLGVDLWEYKQT